MKLAEVKPAIEAMRDSVCETVGATYEADTTAIHDALAEAFIAGVRSSGLKFRTDVQLWAACGCEAAT